MLKLIRLSEIHQLPIGTIEWKKAVYKYAMLSLSEEQVKELITQGTVTIEVNVGQCSDHKCYNCDVTITKVGNTTSNRIVYHEI